jgi:hypothetical protein
MARKDWLMIGDNMEKLSNWTLDIFNAKLGKPEMLSSEYQKRHCHSDCCPLERSESIFVTQKS